MNDRFPVGSGESGSRPPRIFLNYRREDAAPYAGRLYDSLAQRFGEANVFMDVDTIALGVDYTEAIDRALASCDAVVTLIGRGWLQATDAQGRRRLDDPGDVLRLELERALVRPLLVVPTCVQGAPLPREEELPPTLAPLARRPIARENAGVGTDSGACTAGGFLGEGTYQVDGATAGRRFCYFEGSEATMVWTDEARVGGRANVWSGTGAAAAETLLTQWNCCFRPQR